MHENVPEIPGMKMKRQIRNTRINKVFEWNFELLEMISLENISRKSVSYIINARGGVLKYLKHFIATRAIVRCSKKVANW